MALCFLALAPSARGETEILAGRHRVIYDIVNPIGVERIVNYKNNGYEIRVLDEPDEFSKRVLVEVTLDPLKSAAPYPIPPGTLSVADEEKYLRPEEMIQVGHPEIRALAKKLAAGAATVAQVYDRIANHLRDAITYDASPNVQQDALSVLRTGRGSCVGFTTLSIALLRSDGIPARYAHGYLPPGYEWGITQEYWGVKTSGGGYHAWLELYYPDMGWTFSDGEYSKNFVDPYHILRYTDGVMEPPPAGAGSLDVDQGATFTLVEEKNETQAVDGYDEPQKTILGRPLGARHKAALVGRVLDEKGAPVPEGQAIYWENGRGTVRNFNHGQYAFVALDGGKQRVSFRVPGFAEAVLEVALGDRELQRKDVTLQRGALVRGRVLNEIPLEARAEASVLLWEGRRAKRYSLGEKGEFLLEGLEPGGYRLTFEIKGFENREETLELAAGQEKNLEVTLSARGWVEGRVLTPEGGPASGYVYIRREKSWPGYPVDAQGHFVILGLEEGDYDLKAKGWGKGEAAGGVRVKGVGRATVELRYP